VSFASLATCFGGNGSEVVGMVTELEMLDEAGANSGQEQLEGNTYTFVSGQDPLERKGMVASVV
jgi:hypothetical protein